MSGTPNPRRQPDLYWKRLGQLKAASICIRQYRNRLTRWVRAIELLKAVGSGGAIAGWVIWKDWPSYQPAESSTLAYVVMARLSLPLLHQRAAESDGPVEPGHYEKETTRCVNVSAGWYYVTAVRDFIDDR
jgi:hypothetical protein